MQKWPDRVAPLGRDVLNACIVDVSLLVIRQKYLFGKLRLAFEYYVLSCFMPRVLGDTAVSMPL